ncbi:MAG: 50S ribosomal protein L11 methyltransferase [Alphaproteobacteria bacterium]|nr:50S ribosomal protein L11 methyltransferase [Alphaproteobacteria bacterium]
MLFQIDLRTFVEKMDLYLDALDVDALSMSWELFDDDQMVHFQGVYGNEESFKDCLSSLHLITSLQNDADCIIESKTQALVNWLEIYAKATPPLQIGRFYIYGSHDRYSPKPCGVIPLWVDAATAFGSGEHATTSGCLKALQRIKSNTHCHKILDMGCGTGILALAAHKLWPSASVFAGDIDPEAVRVARINMRRNQASFYIDRVSGFKSRWILEKGPYDVIVANILAKPLRQMALDMHNVVRVGTKVVLSGVLTSQEKWVLDMYRLIGFKTLFIFRMYGWSTMCVKYCGA